LIERNDNKLVLNLANVPYMDSGGLGEVVRSYTTVKRAGGDLKLLNATKRISDLLTITKLITVFEIHEDEAAAVASFA
jgi:anti-sigma B factor antagonist